MRRAYPSAKPSEPKSHRNDSQNVIVHAVAVAKREGAVFASTYRFNLVSGAARETSAVEPIFTNGVFGRTVQEDDAMIHTRLPDGSIPRLPDPIVVAIRHDQRGYGIRFGRTEVEDLLRQGPIFATLDEAIAWIDAADRARPTPSP